MTAKPKKNKRTAPALKRGDILGTIHSEIQDAFMRINALTDFHRAVKRVLATGKYPELEDDINAELKAIGEEHGQ